MSNLKKADKEFISKLEMLFKNYAEEIKIVESEGLLKPNTSKTYLTHSENFVRWISGDFTPGDRNSKK